MRPALAMVLFCFSRAALGDEAEGLYDRLCLPCHGERGDGRGPAAPLMDPAPRDFTKGAHKLRSTPTGSRPLEDDLVRTIARGVPGTWMPAWQGTLTDGQIRSLARRVQRFASPAGSAPAPISLPSSPPPGDESRGRRIWERSGCAECHGDRGDGDGPSVADLRNDDGRPTRPYSLRTSPLRGGSGVLDLARTLATGMDGTPMPSYREALDDQALIDLAVYLRSLQSREVLATPAQGGAGVALLPSEARTERALPHVPDPESMRGFFRYPIPRQGPAPPHLTPAEASIDPGQCGRCHAEQFRTWSESRHAMSYGPGFLGQMRGADPGFVYSCHRCHAPLTEQLPLNEVDGVLGPNPDRLTEFAGSGVNCAVCHLRNHVRHGPTPAEPRRIAAPSYPLEVAGQFERSDFCLPCHQHSMDVAVGGKPPLDTYREWLASPYFRRGLVCQSCHMPERAHTWKGIHDPATVRQALQVEPAVRRSSAGVEVSVRVTNAGCGHMLPTTPTPAIFVHIALIRQDGELVTASHEVVDVLRRELAFRQGGWVEVADTRLAPGGSRVSHYSRRELGGATAVRVEVEVRPDFHYEGLYRSRLRTAGGAAARELGVALERATSSSFVAYRAELSL